MVMLCLAHKSQDRLLDIDGDATSKWCPAEGEVVVAILRHLVAAGTRNPYLYIITPFRVVAQELQARIRNEFGLLDQLGVEEYAWLRDRVGTIHTFQGKEAEAVVAVLGAPMASQHGARRWASSEPNILNVLVSRAKQRLYVVGSRAAWQGSGLCQIVADALPVSSGAAWNDSTSPPRKGTRSSH
jgi:superfamily I DNA and/or RNA helicase